MATPSPGDTVTVHYIGTLDNGRIFSSTQDEEPATFTLGTEELFPQLEKEILTMHPGEVRNISIRSADAYGERRKENIIKVDRRTLPETVRVGQKLSVEFRGATRRVMQVTEVAEDEVTLDGNHPLAGQDLTFALRLVSVSPRQGVDPE